MFTVGDFAPAQRPAGGRTANPLVARSAAVVRTANTLRPPREATPLAAPGYGHGGGGGGGSTADAARVSQRRSHNIRRTRKPMTSARGQGRHLAIGEQGPDETGQRDYAGQGVAPVYMVPATGRTGNTLVGRDLLSHLPTEVDTDAHYTRQIHEYRLRFRGGGATSDRVRNMPRQWLEARRPNISKSDIPPFAARRLVESMPLRKDNIQFMRPPQQEKMPGMYRRQAPPPPPPRRPQTFVPPQYGGSSDEEEEAASEAGPAAMGGRRDMASSWAHMATGPRPGGWHDLGQYQVDPASSQQYRQAAGQHMRQQQQQQQQQPPPPPPSYGPLEGEVATAEETPMVAAAKASLRDPYHERASRHFAPTSRTPFMRTRVSQTAPMAVRGRPDVALYHYTRYARVRDVGPMREPRLDPAKLVREPVSYRIPTARVIDRRAREHLGLLYSQTESVQQLVPSGGRKPGYANPTTDGNFVARSRSEWLVGHAQTSAARMSSMGAVHRTSGPDGGAYTRLPREFPNTFKKSAKLFGDTPTRRHGAETTPAGSMTNPYRARPLSTSDPRARRRYDTVGRHERQQQQEEEDPSRASVLQASVYPARR